MAGAAPAYLPDATCTAVDNGADDTNDAFAPLAANVIKVLYVHASDQPNQLAAYYPILSQAVRDSSRLRLPRIGRRKSIRFDLGTSAGPDCVDIQRVSLPRPEAYYVPSEGTRDTLKLRTDILPRVATLETGATFQCRIDDRELSGCAASFQAPRLGFGRHRLAVTAFDDAGNAGASTAVKRFQIIRKR